MGEGEGEPISGKKRGWCEVLGRSAKGNCVGQRDGWSGVLATKPNNDLSSILGTYMVEGET